VPATAVSAAIHRSTTRPRQQLAGTQPPYCDTQESNGSNAARRSNRTRAATNGCQTNAAATTRSHMKAARAHIPRSLVISKKEVTNVQLNRNRKNRAPVSTECRRRLRKSKAPGYWERPVALGASISFTDPHSGHVNSRGPLSVNVMVVSSKTAFVPDRKCSRAESNTGRNVS
jgi:hypothetical protein